MAQAGYIPAAARITPTYAAPGDLIEGTDRRMMYPMIEIQAGARMKGERMRVRSEKTAAVTVSPVAMA